MDLDLVILDGAFKDYRYKYGVFSFTSNIMINRTEPEYSEISIKVLLDIGPIESIGEFSILKVTKDHISLPFDEYNFRNIELGYITDRQIIRSHNKIDLDMIRFYPELEYGKYIDTADNEDTTIEFNQGVGFDIIDNVKIYLNARYKRYDSSSSGIRSFIYYFADVAYYFKENIYIGLSYGLDPRLVHPYRYGFEYSLVRETGSDLRLNNLIDVENQLSKNNFIVLRGLISF